jgi:hypothetical protein
MTYEDAKELIRTFSILLRIDPLHTGTFAIFHDQAPIFQYPPTDRPPSHPGTHSIACRANGRKHFREPRLKDVFSPTQKEKKRKNHLAAACRAKREARLSETITEPRANGCASPSPNGLLPIFASIIAAV